MATPMAMAPPQSFMTNYQKHLDELEQAKIERDSVDNGAEQSGTPACCDPEESVSGLCLDACISLICCCFRPGCISKLGPCCSPGRSADQDIAECSCTCCYGFVKALTCMKLAMCTRGCERACICNPCRKKLPFEEWSCFQYMVMGAIKGLGDNLPLTNIHAIQALTTLPYGTGVFRQCGLKVKCVSSEVKGRKVSGEWIEPEGAPADKVLLYFSGGAFVLQNAAAARWYIGFFAKYLGWKTFSANYGHPPQMEYLDIMDGLVATWDWLIAQGVKPENVVIGGDSAGGNLAISLALRLRYSEAHRDQGQPGGLLLFSPWVNMYPFTSKSFKKNHAFDYIANRKLIQLMVDLYVQDNDPSNPLFSLYRMPEEELAEMPPIFVSAGGCEVLNWSIKEFFTNVEKARKHNVSDVLYEAKGMPHVGPMLSCTHPFPDVKYVPCLCRASPCLAPCCCCGHCLVASDAEKAKEHPSWNTLEKMRVFLQELGQAQTAAQGA